MTSSREVPWIAISALEHHAYCPRQAALIHVDGYFADDASTIRGNFAHRVVHDGPKRLARAPGVRTLTGVPVRSDRLCVHGVCDVVEVHRDGSHVPVEHKVGRHRSGPVDVQIAAQVICLREAGLTSPYGVVFSHAERTRRRVEITGELLGRVHSAVAELRVSFGNARLPIPVNDQRCRTCSLREECLPTIKQRVSRERLKLFDPQPLGSWDA